MDTDTAMEARMEQYKELKKISSDLKAVNKDLETGYEERTPYAERLKTAEEKQESNEEQIRKLKRRIFFRRKAKEAAAVLSQENEELAAELAEVRAFLDEKDTFLNSRETSKKELETRRDDIFRGLNQYWKKELSLEIHEDAFELDIDAWKGMKTEFQKLVQIFRPDIKIGKSMNDLYFQSKKQEKAVVMVGLGKNVRGNMAAILDVLNHEEAFADFKMYVRTSEETDALVQEFIRQNGWTRTETLPKAGKFNNLLESAEFLITEVFFPEGWIKQPFQKYINIWHGTPLKKLGLAKQFKTAHKNGNTQKNFIEADYLLYPNEYTKDNMLESYKVSQLLSGQTFLLGYPRTGTMMAAAAGNLDDVYQKLAPNGEKIYAYMPTFRDYLKVEQVVAQAKELLDYLEKNLSDRQILYVNLHHRVNDSLDYSVYKRVKKFPSDIDSYRLLAASDALITDYSSVFFDYLALRKQIVLYISDYATYRKKRGMYMDIMELPFDKAKTPEEVLNALNAGKQYDDREVFERFCGHDSAENAKKLCSLLLDGEPQVELSKPERTAEQRALVYSDAFASGKVTKFLHEFTKAYDRSKDEVYLSCWVEKADGNRGSAYPMMFETPVIGGDMILHFTGVGAQVRELMMEESIPFEQAMAYLKYDYSLISRRQYGSAEFESIVIYDAEEADSFLFLAEMDAPKILFLQEKVCKRIEKGDHVLANAVRYAAKYSRAVCVLKEGLKERGEAILGDYWKDKIQVVDSPKDMCMVVFGRVGKEEN